MPFHLVEAPSVSAFQSRLTELARSHLFYNSHIQQMHTQQRETKCKSNDRTLTPGQENCETQTDTIRASKLTNHYTVRAKQNMPVHKLCRPLPNRSGFGRFTLPIRCVNSAEIPPISECICRAQINHKTTFAASRECEAALTPLEPKVC